ncbi:MAB_1171c family putative transporter [Streptomyces sp. NBC_01304]|uniref:MAB_1171c family putative transporter n=1 Tax=Streptomyces sp. NBC_01304 TaxID=2903818 RepID=UPI002E0E57AE|nr:hypothetical protein OG430_36300 [Streptomyces sp. NBC_01304]
MRDTDYYIPAVILGLGLLAKVPGLIRRWRDPLVWVLCLLMFLGSMVFTFAAPPTIRRVNALTGVVNLSAPMDYVITTTLATSCFILLISWHGGAPRMRRRAVMSATVACVIVSVLILILFSLGSTPVERLKDFDTYYANAPFIREMIVLYVSFMGSSCVLMAVLCWRWSLQVSSWLKGGLVWLTVAYGITSGYAICKLAAVGARWAGADWDALSTNVSPPLAAVGGVLATMGFVLPLAGPRAAGAWHDWRTYRSLGPLMRELHAVHGQVHEVRLPPWSSLTLRKTARETLVRDGLLRLGPYLDAEVHAAAVARARKDGHRVQDADIIGGAAMLAAAVQAELRAPDGPAGSDPGRTPSSLLTPNPHELVAISRAMQRSRIVEHFRHQENATEGAHR